MKRDLDKLLCERYPKIFADRHKPMTETAMCWGFDCGDGWFNIIDKLCANIQGHIDWREEQRQSAIDYNAMVTEARAGDTARLDEYLKMYRDDHRERTKNEMLNSNKLRDIPDPISQVTASQVKEKFGTLRFYYSGGDDYIDGLSAMAESMSAVTCEECGSPGKVRHSGWLRALCDVHATAAGYLLKDEELESENTKEDQNG